MHTKITITLQFFFPNLAYSLDRWSLLDEPHQLVLAKHRSPFLANHLLSHEGPIEANP
jgi:hypothetical protein